MSNLEVRFLLDQLDGAFAGPGDHSLLSNMLHVRQADWTFLSGGQERPMAQIFWHVIACKWMYDHYAFGPGEWSWEYAAEGHAPFVPAPNYEDNATYPLDGAVDWAQAAHAQLRSSVEGLSDTDLAPRMTNWGEETTSRWIVQVMIEHDLYHAGEVNHIRSLSQRTDSWLVVPPD